MKRKTTVTFGIPAYKRSLKAGGKDKVSVSIGIPAYNEEANIKNLLQVLLAQKEISYRLKEIIVISDGSTDKTDYIIKKLGNPKITLIRNRRRLGQPKSQNVMTKKADGDILIIINADVIPASFYFIENIIKPFKSNKSIGIVGADTQSKDPKGFFESIIIAGRTFKKSVYVNINQSSNVYLCHGRARAFTKKLYKKIVWPDDCPEDAYSYFYCITNGFKFKFSPQTMVYFRSPSNLIGHKKQHDRFIAGKKNMENHFGQDLMKSQYKIPKNIFFKQLLISLISDPFRIPLYFLITLYLDAQRLMRGYMDKRENYSLWQMSVSSKKI